jgi:hypothetical protein
MPSSLEIGANIFDSMLPLSSGIRWRVAVESGVLQPSDRVYNHVKFVEINLP